MKFDKTLIPVILVVALIAISFTAYYFYAQKKAEIISEPRDSIMVSPGQMDSKTSADFFQTNKGKYIKTKAAITEVNKDNLVLEALDVKTGEKVIIKADFGYSLSDYNLKNHDIIMLSGCLDNFTSNFSGLNKPIQNEWTLSRCRIEKE